MPLMIKLNPEAIPLDPIWMDKEDWEGDYNKDIVLLQELLWEDFGALFDDILKTGELVAEAWWEDDEDA